MFDTILESNFILACDSYKLGHIGHLPKGAKRSHANIVPRKPFTDEEHSIYIDEVVVLGPQVVAAILASIRITDAMIDEAEIEITEQGYDFPRAEWEYLRDLGYLPLQVRSVAEGSVVPVGLPIMTIENTDGWQSIWLPSYVETWAQDIVWKMTTTASKLRMLRAEVDQFCADTGTPPEAAEYMIHNFGDRGAGGQDGAIMAGIAHAVFFSGSDCTRVNRYLKKIYKASGPVLGSVDANEHFTVCANSDCENLDDSAAFEMNLETLARAVERSNRGVGVPVISCLIDTFDDERYVKKFILPNYARICEIGGKYVCRPDSGDPIEKPIEVANWLRSGLRAQKVFGTINIGDFWSPPPNIGVIQGDGLKLWDFRKIFARAIEEKLAASNFCFGFGGGLTNGSTRDDFSFSMKATALSFEDDEWVAMFKKPKTDPGKNSLKGRVTVFRKDDGSLIVGNVGDEGTDIMECIFHNGCAAPRSFDDVRARARS